MINHAYAYLEMKEPLPSAQVVPQPTGGVPGNRSSRNLSPQDWERHNVIERTGGSVHVHCELLDVQHGNLGGDPNGDDLATLMVFQFRFDPQKQSRRVRRAIVKVEFFPAKADGSGPAVYDLAPNNRWGVMPIQDHEEAPSSSELSLGSSQASGKVNWPRDISTSTTATLSGEKRLATGKDMGDYTCATWTLYEHRTKSGVPNMIRVAVLVRREDDEPFHAVVSAFTDTDMATRFGQLFRKVPLDDPVLFNPKTKGTHLREARAQEVLNLGDVDLYSFYDASISSKAKCRLATNHCKFRV